MEQWVGVLGIAVNDGPVRQVHGIAQNSIVPKKVRGERLRKAEFTYITGNTRNPDIKPLTVISIIASPSIIANKDNIRYVQDVAGNKWNVSKVIDNYPHLEIHYGGTKYNG